MVHRHVRIELREKNGNNESWISEVEHPSSAGYSEMVREQVAGQEGPAEQKATSDPARRAGYVTSDQW
jgi:hypothetical protein